ncbi:MAG: hypothetical protein AB7N76_34255 [Planctomycetota bacterium]
MSWKITYVGEGVRSLGAVGVFQRGTRATVTEEVARGLEGDKDWQVSAPGAAPAPAPAAAPAAKEEAKPEAKKDDVKKDDAKKDDAKKDDAKKDDAKADDKAKAKK